MARVNRQLEFVAMLIVAALFAETLLAADSVGPSDSAHRPASFPLPGEWPCFRGNSALDGHVSGKGAIREPKVVWRYPVRSTVTKLVLLPQAGGKLQTIDVPPSEPGPANDIEHDRWFASQSVGLVEGREQPIEKTETVNYADVLPDAPGLEKIEFVSAFATPTVDGRWQYGPGRMFAWRDGSWQKVWETEAIDHSFCPYPLIGDFDGDGQLEVAMLPWYSLHVYDATTGKLEQQCKFTDGRSYGFFGVYDFDRDGKSEFLVMADFSKHIEVLGYRDGKLTLLWQAKIEPDIARPKRVMRVLPEPVADFDLDGKPEIIVNLYNNDDDSSWRVTIFDALTGASKANLPGEIAQGCADLDGDGAPEILTVATSGQHVPLFGTIRAYRLTGGKFDKICEESASAWQCHDVKPGSHQHNSANYGHYAALIRRVDGRDRVVVKSLSKERTGVELSVRGWDGSRLQKQQTIVAENLSAVALDENCAMLVDVVTPPAVKQSIEIQNARVETSSVSTEMTTTTATAGAEPTISPPAVVRLPGADRPNVVAFDSSGMAWCAFAPPEPSAPGQEVHRLAPDFSHHGAQAANGKGRLSAELADIQQTRYGPTIAALAPGEARYLIVAGATRQGVTSVAAIDMATWQPVWQREFEQFASGGQAWNPGGPMLWQSGEFTTPSRQDVLITLQRSRMHSEETFLLRGDTGEIVWHRDAQIADRGFGGMPFAIADFSGNGLDDLASFFPDLRYIADGATGKDLLAEQNYWNGVPLRPVYWGQPVAGRFDRNSTEESLLFTTFRRQMVGRVRADGSLAWSDAYDKAGNGLPAIGDFDGDGAIDVIFIGFDDGIRCYDAASGQQRWTLDLARQKDVNSAASGDIDGDGKDEAVFVLDNVLYCIGAAESGTAGRVEWELRLPTKTSDPILADVSGKKDRGDCRLSVLLTGSDGYVYCVDSATNSPLTSAASTRR